MNVWVCVGSGPSLIPNDIDYCRDQGWNLATCNMGYTVLPDAKVFHAMDSQWWAEYSDEVFDYLNPKCQMWTGCPDVGATGKARLVTWDGDGGWSDTVGHCHTGKLSGLQLINIVGWYKPDLIILLGYDNQARPGKQHWHPDYPKHLKNGGTIDQKDDEYAKLWSTSPISIVNCSRLTNIDGVPRETLEGVNHAIEKGLFSKDRKPEYQS